MLVIDYSSVGLISILALEGKSKKKIVLDESLCRHIILSNILFLKRKFQGHKEIIIACDDRQYWRKDIFPHYKANRVNKPNAEKIDWNNVFRILEKVKSEIKEYFPYKVVQVPNCEADDIIAVLSRDNNEKTVIISSDKDFIQLQVNPNITQYSFQKKKMLVSENPISDLHVFIMEGDAVDGIPNFLSSDDCLVTGTRQKSMMKKKLEEWKNINDPSLFCDSVMLRGYYRNKSLIDLKEIPENYCNFIKKVYNSVSVSNGGNLFQYFIDKKLKNLMSDVGYF